MLYFHGTNVGIHDLPKRNGKLKDLAKFDAMYFQISPKQADKMDPGLRMLFEVSYEAIVDAGKIYYLVKLLADSLLIINQFKFCDNTAELHHRITS